MNQCHICNSTGKTSIQAHEWTPEGMVALPAVEINCIWCEGTGQMTHEQVRRYIAYVNKWCRCGNPSEETAYFSHAGYHGWVCCDCGKVVQEG